MVKFAARFPDSQIVVPLAQQLSWSHFIALLPLKSDEAFLFYAQDAVTRRLGKRELRKQISRKAYERREIANSQLTEASNAPFNMFKDPYLLDILGLNHTGSVSKGIQAIQFTYTRKENDAKRIYAMVRGGRPKAGRMFGWKVAV